MPRAAILGPGGVGGFLAAALSRAGGEPVVVAREETAELIDRDGLKVESVRLGEFAARPRAAATLEEPVEVLFVATKSTGLDAGLERIRAEPELVVPWSSWTMFISCVGVTGFVGSSCEIRLLT